MQSYEPACKWQTLFRPLRLQNNRWVVFYSLHWTDEMANKAFPIKRVVFSYFVFLFQHILLIPFPCHPFSFISLYVVYLCVLLFFSRLWNDRWCVSKKNWTSPVKLVFCGETDGSLYVPDRSIGDCLCHTNKQMYSHTHTQTHICKGERTSRLFMLRWNKFLWAIDCCLWENTLLSCRRCNLDCSMTNNELQFWRKQLQHVLSI